MSTIPRTEKPLKIFFYMADGLSRINACIGLAQTLTQRGHRTIFMVNSVFDEKLRKYGFETVLLYDHSKAQKTSDQPKDAKPWKQVGEMMRSRGFFSSKTPLEKYKMQAGAEDSPFLKGIRDQILQFDQQIEKAIIDGRPDIMIIDQFLLPPSILKTGIPWAYLNSGNPIPVFASRELPPRGSGKCFLAKSHSSN